MNAKSRDPESTRLAEQAAEWLERLERGDPAQNEPFTKWLTESRRNVEAFLLATAIEKTLDDVDLQRSIDVDALMARAGKNVIALAPAATAAGSETANPHGHSAPRRAWRWAAGFAVVAATASTWRAFDGWNGRNIFTTGVGEQRTVRLEDGSLLQLNTHSRVRVSFTRSGRDLHLVYGEALFGAERDPARPFRVHAGGTIVQAIGTRFNVYHRANSTTVAVLEGIVQITPGRPNDAAAPDPGASVAPTRLSAGSKAEVAGTGRVLKLAAVDSARTVAWRQRRLMFDKDSLADIADEFNRYNVSPRIQVDGETARAKRYTGVFDADDPSSLLQYLERDDTLAIDRHDAQIVIRAVR